MSPMQIFLRICIMNIHHVYTKRIDSAFYMIIFYVRKLSQQLRFAHSGYWTYTYSIIMQIKNTIHNLSTRRIRIESVNWKQKNIQDRKVLRQRIVCILTTFLFCASKMHFVCTLATFSVYVNAPVWKCAFYT